MDKTFPNRTDSHQLEELSERYFRQSLPKNWTVEKPANDYGVDLRVDLFEENKATGLELLVQLKASVHPTGTDTESIRLRTATYNHLWNKLQVAILVKYIESEGEAYWLLFRDIPSPSQDQETFTVQIPKANRLSSIEWSEIQTYIRGITDKKLAAMRQRELGANNAGV